MWRRGSLPELQSCQRDVRFRLRIYAIMSSVSDFEIIKFGICLWLELDCRNTFSERRVVDGSLAMSSKLGGYRCSTGNCGRVWWQSPQSSVANRRPAALSPGWASAATDRADAAATRRPKTTNRRMDSPQI